MEIVHISGMKKRGYLKGKINLKQRVRARI
jgi:hypothetical protein